MALRVLAFATLTLAALGLVPGAVHLLELPAKLRYDAAMYAQVTSTLYGRFGAVGGTVQFAAAALAVLLAYLWRQQPGAWLGWVAAGALLLSLLAWGLAVAPVNAAWARAGAPGTDAFVAAYAQLRNRWEFGHIVAFAVWFVGWCALAARCCRLLGLGGSGD
ncbi:MAG: hypothetical protein U1F53_09640 [Burkholderiaceae bacterium]